MTLKQRRLAENLGKSRSLQESMIKSGYAPSTAHQQSSILKTKGWQELVEQHLPDEKLLQKHEEALEATKWNDFTGEREEDHMVRLKAVELGYKAKGRLNNVSLTQVNIGEMGVQFVTDVKSETT